MEVILQGGTDFVFSNNGENISFPTKSVINKRNLTTRNQVTLLNAYLKWKGEDYMDLLWSKVKRAKEVIDDTLMEDTLVYIKEITEIIDIIDLMDIHNYIKNVYRVIPPSNLLDKFTDEIKAEGRYYEDQTFVKSEYLELAALAIAGKIVLGPISYFLYANQALCSGKSLEYDGFNFIRKSKLFHSPPMVKTLKMVDNLCKGIDPAAFIIDLSIPVSELSVYILSITFFQRIATATIIDDDAVNGSLVTNVFGYTSSKLNNTGDVSRVIRNNKPPSASGDENSASVIEVYKAVTDLTPGDIVTMNWINESIESVLHHAADFISEKVPVDEAYNVLSKLEIFREVPIPEQTSKILACILKSVCPPPSKDNLDIDSFLNRLAVAYVFLKNSGHPEIATIITSRVSYDGGGSTHVSRDRLGRDNKEALAVHFENSSVVEEWINKLSMDYLDNKWTSIIDDTTNGGNILPEFKPKMAELLIYIEENS